MVRSGHVIARGTRQPVAFRSVRNTIAANGWLQEVCNAPRHRQDDAALALLYLTLHDGYRAWKGFDWDVLGRLHDKGMIDDPVGKVKSVVFTPEGLERAKELFETMFKK
jgi:hypothetical protein